MRAQFEFSCRDSGSKIEILEGRLARCINKEHNRTLLFIGHSLPETSIHLPNIDHHIFGNPEKAFRVAVNIGESLPDVVYANFMGQWALHLEPAYKWPYPSDRFYFTADRICRKIQDTLSEGAARVVLMTTHTVCEEKHEKSWSEVLHNDPNNTKGCRSYITNGCPGLENTRCAGDQGSGRSGTQEEDSACPHLASSDCNEDLMNLCVKSTFTKMGSDNLAHEELNAARICTHVGERLKIVDAHAITATAGCSMTRDGRHYASEVVAQEVDALFQAALN